MISYTTNGRNIGNKKIARTLVPRVNVENVMK
jgi:hypothetical protein